MAVPTFYEFMPYIIECLGDKGSHSSNDIHEYCANRAGLSDADKTETTSRGIPKYRHRIAWARTYLKKAGLIENPQKGQYILTEAGAAAYEQGAECVTLKYLKKFDSFNEFYGKAKKQGPPDNGGNVPSEESETVSPQEQIENALNELNSELADELMTEIMKMSPYEFERLVVRLLIAMGYGKMEENTEAVTVKSGDEGIDGIVSADKFGFDSIYIQAKQWKTDSVVGRPEIQKFLGALAGQGASKGIFITTANFSKEAVEFAAKQLHSKIVLVNGKMLARLMIEYDLGVSTVATYSIKRIDSDFFDEYM